MIQIHLWDHNFDPHPDSLSSTQKVETLNMFARQFSANTGEQCSLEPPEALWGSERDAQEARITRCNELIAHLDIAKTHIVFLHCSYERRLLSEHLKKAAAGSPPLRIALLHFSDSAAPDANFWGYPDQNYFKGLVRWLGRRSSSGEYLLGLASFLTSRAQT